MKRPRPTSRPNPGRWKTTSESASVRLPHLHAVAGPVAPPHPFSTPGPRGRHPRGPPCARTLTTDCRSPTKKS